jgi:hypothetical protein
MKNFEESRRQFLKLTGLAAGASLLSPMNGLARQIGIDCWMCPHAKVRPLASHGIL